MGKTSITLAARKLIRKDVADSVLIIAPLGDTWYGPKGATSGKTPGTLIIRRDGPQKNKALQRDADIYVINPDGLRVAGPHAKAGLTTHR